MTKVVNLESRPATVKEVAAFEKEHGVGYRHVRAYHGRCANCGDRPLPVNLHTRFDGEYSCEATLPAQWPMTATGKDET